jgi:hypothetical protein
MGKLFEKVFGKGTNLLITLKKGLRASLGLIGAYLITNLDSVTGVIMKIIPDSIESISVSGVGAETITVYAVIVFVLTGLANILKQMPFTKNNQLIRTITG